MKIKLFILYQLLYFSGNAQISFVPFDTTQIAYVSNMFIVDDFNCDSLDDLVVATEFYFDSTTDFHLFIYKQENNELVYQEKIQYATNSLVTSMASGDVNNDELQDLIMLHGDSVKIFYQRSDGFFSKEHTASYYSGRNVHGLACGDLNNDSLIDIAVSHWHYLEDSINVFYQVEDGSFRAKSYYKKVSVENELIIEDMNNDGLNDLVLSNGRAVSGMVDDANEYSFAIYLQDSSTSLLHNHNLYKLYDDIRNDVNGIDIADLNNDGLKDVVTTRGYEEIITIWYQNKNNPLLFDNYPIGINDTYQSPGPVRICDLDDDNKLDIVIGHPGWSKVSVFTSNENYEYSLYNRYFVWVSTHALQQNMRLGDLNGDNKLDVVISYSAGVSTIYNNSNTSAVEEISNFSNNTFSIYPNPSRSNIFFIKYIEYQDVSWILYNSKGIIVSSGELQSETQKVEIDFPYSYGIYFMQLNKNNLLIDNKKIVLIP